MAKTIRTALVPSEHFKNSEKNKQHKFQNSSCSEPKSKWLGWEMLSADTLAPRDEVVDELMLKISLLNQLN